MPNCNICGKPVLSAPVHHPECWKKEVEAMAEIFCDNCHWPYVETDQDALDIRCEGCTIEAEIRKLKEGAVATITTVFCEAIKATQENIPGILMNCEVHQ